MSVAASSSGRRGPRRLVSGQTFVRRYPRAVVNLEGGTYRQGSLQRHLISLNALNGRIGNGSLAVFQDRRDIDGFPGDWGLGRCQCLALYMDQGEGSSPWQPRRYL